ncbi:unnamed protein product [Amoebophrya sp. A25]|nr:unnamed protein product [Amoebophrya sp. A25]|eukprot:GSA25T00001787001.1
MSTSAGRSPSADSRAIGGSRPSPPWLGYITPDVSVLPLSQLYFDDSCDLLLSPSELVDEIDSYYCPHCLQNLPTREATAYSARCPRCFECGRCGATLTFTQKTRDGRGGQERSSRTSAEASSSSGALNIFYTLSCPGCRWQGGEMLQSARPEELAQRVLARESASTGLAEFQRLCGVFQKRAKESKRIRDLERRLERHSLTAQAAILGDGSSFGNQKRLGFDVDDERRSPVWSAADLEKRLAKEKTKRKDPRSNLLRPYEVLRLGGTETVQDFVAGLDERSAMRHPRDGYLVYSRAAAPEVAGELVPAALWAEKGVCVTLDGRQLGVKESADASQKANATGGSTTETTLRADSDGFRLPEYDGFMLRAAAHADVMRSNCKLFVDQTPVELVTDLAQLQSLTSQPFSQPSSGVSLMQAVEQLVASGTDFHRGPARRFEDDTLFPLRKPLLTKRSRRSRYTNRIVVKPQVNPCSVPPFQKENIAGRFLPHLAVSAKRTKTRSDLHAELLASGESEVFLVFANPLDVAMQITVAEFLPEDSSSIAERKAAELQDAENAGQHGWISPALFGISRTEMQPASAVNSRVIEFYTEAVAERDARAFGPGAREDVATDASFAPPERSSSRRTSLTATGSELTNRSSALAGASALAPANVNKRLFQEGYQREELPWPTNRVLTDKGELSFSLVPAPGDYMEEDYEALVAAAAAEDDPEAVTERRGNKALVRLSVKQPKRRRRSVFKAEKRRDVEPRDDDRETAMLDRRGASEDPVRFYLQVRAEYSDRANRVRVVQFPVACQV